MTVTDYDRNEIAVSISLEWAATLAGPEWQRKEKSRKITPPTDGEWDDYYRAVNALEVVAGYAGITPDIELYPPEPTVEVEYAETYDEWLERIEAKADAEGFPERVKVLDFDQSIVDLYFGPEPKGGVASLSNDPIPEGGITAYWSGPDMDAGAAAYDSPISTAGDE